LNRESNTGEAFQVRRERKNEMSIVITVVSKKVIVQVSDIRLSSIRGAKPLPQLQRKSILVIGKHAAFVFGWAGFAKTDDAFAGTANEFNTGDWLFRALNHIKAVELPLADITGNLTGEATSASYWEDGNGFLRPQNYSQASFSTT
jgi:hypothetical protein